MAPARYQITLANALTKLCWGTADHHPAPPEQVELSIWAVRNEVTGLQVLLKAEHEFVLVTDRANWLHPLGFRPRIRLEARFPSLPAGSVEVFPIGYIEGDDRRFWSETLERSGWAEVPAGRTQAVYIRLRIPADAEPGSHAGQIIAYTQIGFEDESPCWQGKVHLHISPVTLPEPRRFQFHLNLWQHYTAIARYHRVPLWSDAHFALIDRYMGSLAQLGQKALTVIAAEIPWSGQRCYRDPAYPSYLFEHAIVAVRRSPEGQLLFDYTHLDRLLALAARHGLDQEIDLFGLLNIWQDEAYGFGKVAPNAPDAVRVRCYEESTGRFTYLRTAEELRCFIRALHDHLNDLGLLERVRIAADEPANLEAFRQSLAFLQATGPAFRYNAAINHFEFIEEAPDQVSDFVPVLPLACREPERTAHLARRLHARGGKMLWYVCCWPPIPNTFLHSPLVEARLIGWLTDYLNLDGFLRWAFCLWPADPWRRVSWRAPAWSAGDMYFVLPGNDGAPVETLRYEALRMAVQDYELLQMARQRLSPEKINVVLPQAFAHILRAASIADFANAATARATDLYSLAPEDYAAARQVIVTALE